jgi:phage shock protein A
MTPLFAIEHRHTFSLGDLPAILLQLKELLMNSTELVTALTAASEALTSATTQLTKVGAETDSLIQKIADLQTIINSQNGALPAEVVTAAQAVSDQVALLQAAVTAVDNKVPDAPV